MAYKITDTGSDFRIARPRRKPAVIVPYSRDAQDVAIRCCQALNGNPHQIVLVTRGAAAETEEMSESDAVNAMSAILAGIADGNNGQEITGVYRATVHEAVVRR